MKIVDGKAVPDDYPVTESKFKVPDVPSVISGLEQDKVTDSLDKIADEQKIEEYFEPQIEDRIIEKVCKSVNQILSDEQVSAKVRARVDKRIREICH